MSKTCEDSEASNIRSASFGPLIMKKSSSVTVPEQGSSVQHK